MGVLDVIGGLAKTAGAGFNAYGEEKKDRVVQALAADRAAREAERDSVLNALTTAQTNRLNAPAAPEYKIENGQRIDVGAGTASPIEGYVAPVPKPEYRVDNGQRIDIGANTATPIAGYQAPERTRSEASIAAAEGRRAQREDRLQQNFQQEPAIKQAGLLANAVAQLKAAASQKTPQGDLNMLYGAVKLRDPNAVREGELALNNSARSLHTRLFSMWDRALEGRILTDDERQQVMDLVDETVSQHSNLVEPVQARFGAMARQAGADSSYVAPDPFEGMRKPPAPETDASAVRGLNLRPVGGGPPQTPIAQRVQELKAQGLTKEQARQKLIQEGYPVGGGAP